ncbi:cytochrome P450 [Aspergillus pseudonomiae]|uniref:Cytochrome P450 n=1 Tax=Aspergillus pseudonomiae TaxID=1506151 RepID=A0A5N7D7B8_9EURO|nr:cytochrome P450 [Aspergillus pseudonomiae]KAE8402117.1 cytochrome P450 [Aspergillus pseudonomiae]
MPAIGLSWPGTGMVAVGTVVVIWAMLRKLQTLSNDPNAPRCLPYSLPFLKSTIPFVLDGPNFFRWVSCYCQDRWPVRVNLLNGEVYIVQGAKNIAAIFSKPGLTVTRAYSIALKHCFGMEQKAADVYLADTSGSWHRPIPGSQTPWHGRVSYHTHENLVRGLLGAELNPITERIEGLLFASLAKALPATPEWTYGEDLTEFFENHLGSAILEALYGPLLVRKNPEFNRNLWRYDKQIMKLATRLPSWLIPKAYRLRDELLDVIMKWHQQAALLSETMPSSEMAGGSEADPYWGSAMMRERNKMLLNIEGQDAKSAASTDLGFIWASVTNVVPSTMTLCTHMYRDSSLVEDIRIEVRDCIQPGTTSRFDLNKLAKQQFLLSMYAETLRFGVQIHIPRCSPHQPLSVAGATIQPNKMILINTGLAHSDESVWNTRNGQYPLDTFWPQRFLVDPTDKSSGPLRKDYIQPCVSPSTEEDKKMNSQAPTSRQFTLEGLEGSWIPYGGGQHACPGRNLAKRIILLASSMMAIMFDIELLAPDSSLQFGSPRFGFGVRKPSAQVPFRIRRRQPVSEH